MRAKYGFFSVIKAVNKDIKSERKLCAYLCL